MSFVKSTIVRQPRARTMKQYQARRARGEVTMMDVEPVRAHVRKLHAWGLPINSIARLAGLGQTVVHDIFDGMYSRCELRTGRSLLAVSYKPQPGPGMVLAVGAQRRVRALHAIGWSQRRLDVELGLPKTYTSRLMQCGGTCTFEMWLKIRDGYDRLSMVPGGGVRSVNRARSMGWPSPLDWESVDIDDPEAVPLSDRNVGSAAQRRAALAQGLLGQGLSASEVAGRLGVTVRSVERWKNVVIEDE